MNSYNMDNIEVRIARRGMFESLISGVQFEC